MSQVLLKIEQPAFCKWIAKLCSLKRQYKSYKSRLLLAEGSPALRTVRDGARPCRKPVILTNLEKWFRGEEVNVPAPVRCSPGTGKAKQRWTVTCCTGGAAQRERQVCGLCGGECLFLK